MICDSYSVCEDDHELTRRGLCTTLSPGELRRGGTIGALGTGHGTEASERAKPSMLLGSTGSRAENGPPFTETRAFIIRGKSVG
jgi:hypothetical protein